jgi:hypothetical protein
LQRLAAFAAATKPTGLMPQGKNSAESEAVAQQKAQQHTAALGSMVTQAAGGTAKNAVNVPICASTCRSVQELKVGAAGLEPDSVTCCGATDSRETDNPGAAKCAAVDAQSGHFDPALVDADLATVVDAGPGLSADNRAAVLGIVMRAVGDAGDARDA